jgi:hypothetical protein
LAQPSAAAVGYLQRLGIGSVFSASVSTELVDGNHAKDNDEGQHDGVLDGGRTVFPSDKRPETGQQATHDELYPQSERRLAWPWAACINRIGWR